MLDKDPGLLHQRNYLIMIHRSVEVDGVFHVQGFYQLTAGIIFRDVFEDPRRESKMDNELRFCVGVNPNNRVAVAEIVVF